MSLRSRFALAFALVAAVVAALVGALSYHVSAERIAAEIDRSLMSATVALANGQDQVLASTAELGAGHEHDEDGHEPTDGAGQQTVAQVVPGNRGQKDIARVRAFIAAAYRGFASILEASK